MYNFDEKHAKPLGYGSGYKVSWPTDRDWRPSGLHRRLSWGLEIVLMALGALLILAALWLPWFGNVFGTETGRQSPASRPAYIQVGSPEAEVRAVLGTPSRVAGGEWWYGNSRVYFRQGRVTGWRSSPDRPLKTKPAAPSPRREESISSSPAAKKAPVTD